MILIGIGANLKHPRHGLPRATCGAALEALAQAPLTIATRSRWYQSAPIPASDQPWFVNAAVRIKTALDPGALLDLMIATERSFGRRRGEPNAARVLDLDLLAYGPTVLETGATELAPAGARVPHPRLGERAFVLLPLRDVAPGWRHPETGDAIDALIAALEPGQSIEVMADAGGVYGSEWREDEKRPAPAPAPEKQGG